MGSMLNDAAMIEHDNLVGIADGGKTMGNDKCSALMSTTAITNITLFIRLSF